MSFPPKARPALNPSCINILRSKNVSFNVRAGEIVCIAGIDGNGQTELVYGITGLEPLSAGKVQMCGKKI